MPQGHPPTNQLSLYVVFSEGIGAFGPTLEEITRLGLNKLRYVKGAERGAVTTATAFHFANTEQQAIEHLELVRVQQGKEMTLYSQSTDKSWTVFLRSSQGFYQPCVHTDPNKNFIIKYQLEIQRTK
jgi:hypothetical protein